MTRRMLAPAIVAIAAAAGPAHVEAQSCEAGAWLAGVVTDVDTGVPLPAAIIVVLPDSMTSRVATTDATGRFVMCGLATDHPVQLQASFGDFRTEWYSVELTEEQITQVEIGVAVAQAGRTSTIGRLVGQLLDQQSGRPVEAVLLSFPEIDRQLLTDARGRFVLDEVPVGPLSFTTQHVGYAPATQVVEIFGDYTSELRVELSPQAIELEPIVITAVRNRRLETRGFYERRAWGEDVGIGRFATEEDIERRNPLRMSYMVAEAPGVRLWCPGGRGTRCLVRMIGTACSQMTVYVDGIRVIDELRAGFLDDFVRPGEVAAVETYRPSEVPGEYSGANGAQCGVVVIWTRSGT